jgi:maltooligosyltrehalose trehalohydrolase
VLESGGSGIAVALEAMADGYHEAVARDAGEGTLYRFRIDGAPELYPDPASRFQPQGPHGPSAVVDPAAFRWTDSAWPGVTLDRQVIYELHVGTFTREGTFRALLDELPELREAGITLIELMPIADFPGRFGWGLRWSESLRAQAPLWSSR